MLKITTYHIIANPSIHEKLTTELKTVSLSPSSSASLTELERLAYLSAVIQEGLRISYGISH